MENEIDGERRSQHYVQLLKGMFDHRLDHLAKMCKAGDAKDDAKLENLMFAMQQAVKVGFGYHALLEDDHEYFQHALRSTSTMAQR
jgi:hypothetical protein